MLATILPTMCERQLDLSPMEERAVASRAIRFTACSKTRPPANGLSRRANLPNWHVLTDPTHNGNLVRRRGFGSPATYRHFKDRFPALCLS